MANKIYKYFEVIFSPIYRIWSEKNPDESPVREMTIKLSAENINDAQEKAWKTVTLNPNEYEIISLCTDGYIQRSRNRQYGE